MQPADVSAVAGTTATFKITATGAGLTYQWQYSKDSGASWSNTSATGCKTNTLSISVTAGKNGYQYRCIVTDVNGKSVTSNAATLTVEAGISGTCGDNLTWMLDNAGRLTISGKGAMTDFTYSPDNRPWSDYISVIKSVEIKNGVTNIGSYAFDNVPGLTAVSIPASVTTIGMFAFRKCTGLTDVTLANVTVIGMNAFNGCTKLETISFLGDAPTFRANVFYGDQLIAYYPANNTTWTDAVMQQYGGSVFWKTNS